MILECPHCNAQLNAAAAPAPGMSVRCSRCKQVFHPIPLAEASPETDASDDGSAWSNGEPIPEAAPRAEPTRKATQKKSSKFPFIAVGGGVLVIVALLVIIVMSLFGDKPKQADANSNAAGQPQSASPPKKDNLARKDWKSDPPNPPKPQIPAEYAELFRESTDRPAPTVQMPVLKKVGMGELIVPGFVNKSDETPGMGKMTIDEIKRSTTFIENRAGDGSGGTGSGFVIKADRESILVATNHHVIAVKSSSPLMETPKLTVVFESGTPKERAYKAVVVARDPEIDLAILKVPGFEPLPKPISLSQLPKPVETMDVVCFGFPLGFSLASEGRRPTISVSKGAVSNLQFDTTGRVTEIRINAGIQPGNSGGPVVEKDGRLLGVVKSYFKGSAIHNIIPAAEVVSLMTGRALTPSVLPIGYMDGPPAFQVEVPISDPLGKVKEVYLNVWSGDDPPEPEQTSGGVWKPIAMAEKIALAIGPRGAAGKFELPQPPLNRMTVVLLQLVCVNQAGEVAISRPVRHRLIVEAVQTATDAVPLNTFKQNLAKYSGQVVVVRGRLAPGPVRRGALYEFQIADDNAESLPVKVTFLADRDVATQLSELPPAELALDLRLTLRLGKQIVNGATPARITRIDFVGKGNRLLKSIPSSEKVDDQLVALNRAPEKFIGQTVTFLGYITPVILGTDKAPELSVIMVSEQRPENLHFSTTTTLAAKLKDQDLPSDFPYPARFTARVEPRILEGTGAQFVTVIRVELADQEGKTGKIIE